MCGMIWTGMLTRRSEKMKPMWFEDVRLDGPSNVCSLAWRTGSGVDFSRM